LDVGFPAENLAVSIDRTYAGNLRAEARYGYDEHASYKPSKHAWFRVAKLAGLGHFHELRALPIYGSVADARGHNLAGVVNTKVRSWWIELRPIGKDPDFHTAYLLWDAAMQWCGRILPLADDKAVSLPAGNIEIFIKANLPAMSDILSTPASDDLVAVDANAEKSNMTITLNAAFVRGLAEPTNRAEKQLVGAIIDGINALNGSLPRARELLREIVPNDRARFVHFFIAQTVGDNLGDLPLGFGLPWLATEQDSYNAALGVGAELEFAGRHTLIGKAQSQEFLHKAVDILWRRACYRLRKYDRASLIKAVLRNLESISADDAVWERTAAALTSVYKNQEDVLAAARDRSAARQRTALSSRILAEMGVCECPLVGGSDVGRSDYLALIGFINTLIVAAYNSDAIAYDLEEPKVDIWPNGEFGISNRFHETVLAPYQQGRFQAHFKKSAADYANLFAEHKGKAVGEVFEGDFLQCWKEEFGFTIEQLLLVEDVLVKKARDVRDRIVTITVAELWTSLEAAGIESSAVDQILQSLALVSRASWESVPAGFHLRDIEPWKFGRRLSLLRPLLCLHDEIHPGAEIIYAAGFVHSAFGFTVSSAYGGLLHEQMFRSARMRKWIGTVNNRNGHDFNETVRTILESLGFGAKAAVQMTELGVEGMGDIDVLAWTKPRDTVFAIECKHLRFARTVGEVGEQLRRFRGQPGDDLDAHLRRIAWLTQNAEVLKRRLNLRDKFRMHQLLITNAVVPIGFVEGLPIPSDTVIPVDRIPAAMGSRPFPGEIFAES